MTASVDLNADLGESFGSWRMGCDADMLAIVSSANVACGFHAGDPAVMTETVRLAAQQEVSIGAHPGFYDQRGFGRYQIQGIPASVLEADIIYQIGALKGIADAQQIAVRHVKPHGALSNMACVDRNLATTIVQAITRANADLLVFAVANTELEKAARDSGASVVSEVFADRAYLDNGQLVPRSQPDAVIHNVEQAAEHVIRMVDGGEIQTITGKKIAVNAQTICVHGDNPSAVLMAETVRHRLEAAGIGIHAH